MTPTEQPIYENPFLTLAELLRGLRLRFITEAGLMENGSRLSPKTGEILGGIAGLINDCESIRKRIDELEHAEPDAYVAFQRALEKE